jgi:hypothetical protein
MRPVPGLFSLFMWCDMGILFFYSKRAPQIARCINKLNSFFWLESDLCHASLEIHFIDSPGGCTQATSWITPIILLVAIETVYGTCTHPGLSLLKQKLTLAKRNTYSVGVLFECWPENSLCWLEFSWVSVITFGIIWRVQKVIMEFCKSVLYY